MTRLRLLHKGVNISFLSLMGICMQIFCNYKKKWQGKIFLSVESLNTEFFLHLLPLILIFLPVWIQLESGSTTLSTCTLYKCTEYCSGDCSIGLLPTWGCLKSCWWWCPRRVWTAGALFDPAEKYLNKNKKTAVYGNICKNKKMFKP